MARKKQANGSSTPDGTPGVVATNHPRIDIMAATNGIEREVIKVNNANLTELKNACDDAVKTLLSRKELFSTIHTHTDIRLGLGWAGVFVAFGTAFYGYKVEFEKSKPIVWAGVILYGILTVTQALYAYFVERDTVYVGKRKTLAKRIETERISVSSRTVPAKREDPPRYSLSVSYVRSANSGKSLLGRGKGTDQRGYNEFFDEEGALDQEVFDRWVAGVVENVMEEK
ncbi:hypothetical protein BD410DRAFT_826572 [Rickenella mellea]|uniref:Signal peptidase complex subunit 2 n=1 Tax=Rickenella mellea TaxID=50990 RepID=A0A4Y7QDK1_9AGAM|nr:hypothetical protein BD410DRAFT_826572 [Rickenella mellea]